MTFPFSDQSTFYNQPSIKQSSSGKSQVTDQKLAHYAAKKNWTRKQKYAHNLLLVFVRNIRSSRIWPHDVIVTLFVVCLKEGNWKFWLLINPLTAGTFCKKMRSLDILMLFKLDLAKSALIRSKMRLQHNSLPFLPPASRFTTLWLGHPQKSKFWTTSLGFSIFEIFFRLPFFSFSFLCAAVIDPLLGLLADKSYHGAARCSGRKFCSEFFTQTTFWAFLWYLRLHLADHSDLGIIGKIFSSCRSWV